MDVAVGQVRKPVLMATSSREEMHAEMDRARCEFAALIRTSTPVDLARPSNGTRWTNEQLLFHMLFGYLVTRNLRVVVKLVTRLPLPAQRGFVGLLNVCTRPFHHINYWGSRAGARFLSTARMDAWFDRVIASLHRHLDAETDAALTRSMPFPTGWDPYFTSQMTLADVYHYATVHFDHHHKQLTLP